MIGVLPVAHRHLVWVAVSLLAGGCDGCRSTEGEATAIEASESWAGERWIRVPAGELRMGSPEGEACRDADEEPVTVTLTRPVLVGAHEVTQAAFAELMGYDPSWREDCPNCPVDSVSHHEARAYCNALSRQQERSLCYRCRGREAQTRCEAAEPTILRCAGYRLPTEAEWEHAARAGSEGMTPGGRLQSCMSQDEVAQQIAWYKASSRGESHPVGRRAPNRWGLHDLAGNVYEWTDDWYAPRLGGGVDPVGPPSGDERVLRGGSWYHNAEHLRSANRFALPPEKRLSYVGFRCVRSLPSSSPRG